jgi:thiol-disulfide isomerase/thioredoxin
MANNEQLQRTLTMGLRILLAGMFFLSAIAKLYPSAPLALGTFEAKQLIPMGFDDTVAQYFSRILIGCELALGFGLLLPHYFKRLVLPLSFLMLFIFSSQLTYEIITVGNKGNCGCFGALLPMTPVQALVKNILAMGMLIYLFIITNKDNDKRNPFLILTLILASILAIFMVGPIQQKTKITPVIQGTINEADTSITVVDTIATGTDPKAMKDSIPVVKEPKAKKSGFSNLFPDIDKGKKVLCFFAPGCDHCKETAKELTKMKKSIAGFPDIYIVFMDEETELIPDFFTFAGANYPYLTLDVLSFWKTLGNSKDTPGVMYYWNGNLIKEYNGIAEKKFKEGEFKKAVLKKYE